MEDVARRDVEPADVLVAPAARHDAQTSAVVVAPAVRHGAGHRELHVEDDRQIHEDDVALGDAEVVDHRRARHVDDLALHQPSRGVGAVVGEKRGREPVGEEVELAGERALLRMRGHARREPAVVIEAAHRLELARDLRRERRLDEREHAAGVLDDVRVRDAGREIADGRRVLHERPCPHVAIAVPLRAAVAERDSVQHPVAEEPVRRRAGLRVRAIAHVEPAEGGGDGAVDGQVERGHLVRDRREVALQMKGRRRHQVATD